METIGINTMASKSERATRIFILPKVWLLSTDSTDLVKRPSTRVRSQGALVMSSSRPASVASGGGSYSSGRWVRLIQAVRKPKAAAPMTSQRFDETKTASPGAILKHERISLGTRFVEADRVDRENGIEVAADVGCLDGGGEHFRRAVRQNRGGVATRFEIAQNRAGIGKGVERQIGAEQLWLERLIDGRKTREGQIERAFRQRPEIEIAAGERQRPAIFELLGTPELGETIGIGPGGRPIPADGGMHVEKRAIGIEDESAWHGHALRMRPTMIARRQARGTDPTDARSKPRLGQQGRKRPSTDVVDAGEGDAVAHDLDQHRSVELRAVEFPEHHREVGAGRIPGGFEVGA